RETVTNLGISGTGLKSGDRVVFRGSVSGSPAGVLIDPVPGNLSLTFLPESVTSATENGLSAILISGTFDGSFSQDGSARGSFSGVTFAQDFSGTAWNGGSIASGNLGVLFGMGLFSGTFSNQGSVVGGETGVYVMGAFEGEITNSGAIEGTRGYGIHAAQLPMGAYYSRAPGMGIVMPGVVADRQGGVIRNEGGRISGGRAAIQLGFGDDKVILSGPSRIDGKIDGGYGKDVLRFEKMRGISAEKKEELRRLSEKNSGSGSIELFSEVIDWENFEAFEADLRSLQSYESLITAPGLSDFARALDSPRGLDDEFRNFLNALNQVEEEELNEVVANASGQTLLQAWDDLGRDQDNRLFSLLGQQFSSLRGNVSGREEATAARPQGIFANEVPASSFQEVPDGVTAFAFGFVGGGDYEPSLNRSSSRYDATSFVFGAGGEISENWSLGLFGGYGRTEGQVDSFGSEMETRSLSAGVTAQYVNGMFFANLTAGYRYFDSDTTRVDFQGNRFAGTRGGDQGFFFLQSGLDFAFGENRNGRVTPYLGVALSETLWDEFAERGSSASRLRFADDSFTSLQSVVGVEIEGHLETSAGWVKPRIDLAYWQALEGGETSRVSFASQGLLDPYALGVPSSGESRAVLQVGADFSFDSIPNWIFNAGYFGSFGDDGYSSHGGVFGVKIEF
ncbi:MAG: autotransporter outer membrane beta-barrel domain-containing protein, partial [Verrucomicrobiota bacterium]